MDKVTVLRMRFGSYVKFFFLSGVGAGVIMGVIMLIAGLLGAPVYANIGSYTFTGMEGGVVAFLMSPILTGAVFAWFGMLSFLPFKLLLKLFRGITLSMEIIDAEHTELRQEE